MRIWSWLLGHLTVVGAVLAALGAGLAGIGAYRDQREQTQLNRQLVTKSEQIADLNRALAEKSEEVAQLAKRSEL